MPDPKAQKPGYRVEQALDNWLVVRRSDGSRRLVPRNPDVESLREPEDSPAVAGPTPDEFYRQHGNFPQGVDPSTLYSPAPYAPQVAPMDAAAIASQARKAEAQANDPARLRSAEMLAEVQATAEADQDLRNHARNQRFIRSVDVTADAIRAGQRPPPSQYTGVAPEDWNLATDDRSRAELAAMAASMMQDEARGRPVNRDALRRALERRGSR